jgi:hypothetical protein
MFRKLNCALSTRTSYVLCARNQLDLPADPNRRWGHQVESDSGQGKTKRSREFPGNIYQSADGSMQFKVTYLVRTQQVHGGKHELSYGADHQS